MASIQQGPNGPVLVLKESALQQKGKDAQQNNIAAAKLVAQLVRSSLGPRGLDKMLVDSLGDVTITNDGATILKEIDVQHPAAKMMVEISKTVDNEVGDGTTSSVIFGGALLARAEDLLNKDVHSSTIIDGYQLASDHVLEIYSNLAKKIESNDKQSLMKIATTSMQSKLISEDSAKMIVDAKGIVLDKEVVHSGMPTKINNAKIALINSALEIEKTELSSEIRITDPTQMQMFLEEENRMLKSMVDKLHDVGVNVLICQKGIDDISQHYLAKYGIMAVRRVKESDMIKLSKATGGRVVSNLDDLSENDLGVAELAHQKKVESDKWIFIEGCKHPQSVTMLIRGGTQRVIDEVDRSIHDSLMVVKDVVENPSIVAGGGAPEAFAAARLKEWADNFSGREQLAIKKYAEALETIPLTIAENAGMDPIDTMANLRSKQNQGQKWTGIDAKNMKIADMMGINVVEPIVVKEQIIKSATEAACMVLRIDDVIAISGAPGGGGMPPMG